MTARELLRILKEVPSRVWPDAWLHHGARVFLLLLLAGFTSSVFPVTPLPDVPVLERGMVATEDVIAEIAFPILKSEAELARARQDAAAGIAPIFVYDSTAVDTMTARVERFFTRVDSAAAGRDGSAARRRMRDLLAAYAIQPSSEDIDLFMDPAQRARLRRSTLQAIRSELPLGIAQPADLEEVGSQRIRLKRGTTDRLVNPDSVLTPPDFFEAARIHVPPSARSPYEQLQNLILVRFIVPSIRPDWAATEAEQERARAAVDVTKGEVLEGERIVTARERVGDEEIERMRAYHQALERSGALDGGGRRGARSLGSFLLNTIILSLLGVLLYFYRPQVYRELRHVLLVAFLVVSVVGPAAIIATYGAHHALLPIAFPALVVATLWDGRLALNLSLIVAVLLATQTPFVGVSVLLTLVTAGAVASLSVRVVRRRAQIWGFIALISLAYVLCSVVLGLFRTWPMNDVLWWSGWGTLNAIASAFAALGFMPVFESFTRVTTDQTLLELADANRPLLRRLSMEAPGTYAHSINVANLAEAAAGAIDANALLTRVGVYYHDVGKIARPAFFIENQRGGRNPHDRLKPAASAAVVRNHVLEGLKLAEEAKLPDCVKAFILEHHGTQDISFFYDQAREADPEAELDRDDYAYPGPKPQSKETAIVMLADSVESAARVLPDPNPESITELVDRIVRVKMEAGQLDDAPLTVRELTKIKEQFVKVLSGVYHQRIDYPASRGGEPERREPAGQAAGAGSR